MTDDKHTAAARELVDAIEYDLGDRRGLKWEWRKIDDDIREGIKKTWARMIAPALASAYERGRREEREACLYVAEQESDWCASNRDRTHPGSQHIRDDWHEKYCTARHIEGQIRARGEKT
jgi:hypothetical protein